MPTELPSPTPVIPSTKGKITGAKVILMLAAFFGAIGLADAIMVYNAINSYPGEVVDHPYERGLKYNDDIALSEAQEKRGWKVEGRISRDPDGQARVTYKIVDKAGAPVSGLSGETLFQAASLAQFAPTDAKHDKLVALKETDPGVYVGVGAVPAGVWSVIFTAKKKDEQMFKSINNNYSLN